MNVNIDWRAEAAKLRFPDKAFIGGKHVAAASGQTFEMHLAHRRQSAGQGRRLRQGRRGPRRVTPRARRSRRACGRTHHPDSASVRC